MSCSIEPEHFENATLRGQISGILYRVSLRRIATVVSLLLANASITFGAPMIIGLGDTWTGETGSGLLWVSEEGLAGGLTVTSPAYVPTLREGVLLDRTGERSEINDLTGTDYSFSAITSGRRDGSFVSGQIRVDENLHGFTYSEADGLSILPTLNDAAAIDWVHDVSASGNHIVGTSTYNAVIWDEQRNVVPLGSLASGGGDSYGYGISADGSTAVGKALNSFGHIEAFRWTEASGMVGLGGFLDRSDPNFKSQANKISADGSTIVGWTNGPNGMVPYRWTAAEGMMSMGTLPGYWGVDPDYDTYYEIDVSGDGSIVVGTGFSPAGAYIFTQDQGLQSLEDYLVSLGMNLGGWQLDAASGISENGKYIVGTGTNAGGDFEGFLVIIPEPSTALLLGLGFALSSRLRRNHRRVG